MDNNEIAETLHGLSEFMKIKESIEGLHAGNELDKRFATEILGMKYSPLVQKVVVSGKKSIETHYSLANGQPAFLPKISRDNNLAVMLLQDMNRNFDFEYRDGVFKVPFEDKALFTGQTLGEALIKTILFENEIKKSGVQL